MCNMRRPGRTQVMQPEANSGSPFDDLSFKLWGPVECQHTQGIVGCMASIHRWPSEPTGRQCGRTGILLLDHQLQVRLQLLRKHLADVLADLHCSITY